MIGETILHYKNLNNLGEASPQFVSPGLKT